MSYKWYVVITSANRENETAKILDKYDLVSYNPQVKVPSNIKDQDIFKPLFPGYLFAHTKYKGFNGTILDGRDIGSVILPKANYKFFLDANIKIRAKRRTEELLKLGIEVVEQQILKDMIERDKIDKTRENAPLIKPNDAFFIDTSNKSIKEVLRIAIKVIENHELIWNIIDHFFKDNPH